MKISNRGVKLIQQFESCKLKAYRCQANVPTIGWGTTKGVKMGMTVTQQQADQLFLQDLAQFESAVNKLVKVPLRQNQYDALIAFVYNIGITAFSNSTLLRKLNSKEYAGASSEFMRWTKANGKKSNGLKNRRKIEQSLFNEV